MDLKIEALDHLVLNVNDVKISADWYQRVLGMTRSDSKVKPGEQPRTSVKFGQQKINLRPVTASNEECFTANHATAGSGDLCFLTKSKADAVLEHLRALGVVVEEGPVEKQGAVGTLTSVYCRDPDGNLIEISSHSNTD